MQVPNALTVFACLLFWGMGMIHCLISPLFGQPIADTLYPSATSFYDISSGLLDACLEESYVDREGKLWIKACQTVQRDQQIYFYQFDGKNSYPLDMSEVFKGNNTVCQVDQFRERRWLEGHSWKSDRASLFRIDLLTESIQSLDLDSLIEKGGPILSVQDAEDGGQFFFAFHGNKKWCSLFYHDWKELRELKRFPGKDFEPAIGYDFMYLLRNENDLWFKGDNFPVYRYSISEERLGEYGSEAFDLNYPGNYFGYPHCGQITRNENGNILISILDESDRFYQFDPQTERFKVVDGQPGNYALFGIPYKLAPIQEDAQSQNLVVYRDGGSRNAAYLLGKQPIQLSPLLSDIQQGGLLNINSFDFTKSLFFSTDYGLVIKDARSSSLIQQYLDIGTRQIVPINEDSVFIKDPIGYLHLVYEGGKRLREYDLRLYVHLRGETELKTDGKGNLWANFNEELLRFDFRKDNFMTYDLNQTIDRFCFWQEDTLLVVSEGGLYFFSEEKLHPISIEIEGKAISGKLNLIGNDANRWAWIAGVEGLWLWDLQKNKLRHFGLENGLKDERILCVNQDAQGRLWIGTFLAGLHILDPLTNDIQILDKDRGLSHNAIAGILFDEEGLAWLNTYNGVAIVSPEGELITHIYEQDGLSSNEGNRFSAAKGFDGKLWLGSIKGVNVLEPQKVKQYIQKQDSLKVYLTGLEYETEEGAVALRKFTPNTESVTLPADKRSLTIRFGLSNYVNLDQNQFAYMLEGVDKDWTFIGGRMELILPNLPAGSYNLLLKGSDYRGNWSTNLIRIPIEAKAFFYKQIWFYLLLGLLILSLIGLWIYRLRTEVSQRTLQIQEDKALIEAQALQLQELDEAKSRFFTNISHEFRTPLTVILGMAGQIKSHPSAWRKKGLNLIQRNGEVLLNLINQILDLRKLEAGELKLDLIQWDLIAYLKYIHNSFHSLTSFKGIQLVFKSDAESLMMDFDPEKWRSILTNLISNAIKFTPAGGNIQLLIEQKEQNRVVIQLQDSGSGISQEELSHIFDRFYQASEGSYQQKGGTGIGLALVKELVQLMDGTIEVSSRQGEGTTFSIEVPITRNSPVQEPYQTEAKIKETETVLPLPTNGKEEASGPRILLVDDNEDVLVYLQACLQESFQLILAKDGQEGIEKALEEVPDLIVSDVMMPRKDGLELCQTLKEEVSSSHIPIILLTAKADVSSRIEGWERGADAYLAKPFHAHELQTIIRSLLTQREKLQARYAQLEVPSISTSSPSVTLEDAFIQKLNQAILEQLDNTDFKIPELCKTMGMSRTQLHNKTKALTGKSTTAYMRWIRLENARQLLQNSQLSISEIAYQVGFSDLNYFSRTFNETYGERPSSFRKV